VKYPLFLSGLMKLEFFGKNFENTQKPNLKKICPVGAELVHADGRTRGPTDMTELTVAFRHFANSPKTQSYIGTRWKDAEGCQR